MDENSMHEKGCNPISHETLGSKILIPGDFWCKGFIFIHENTIFMHGNIIFVYESDIFIHENFIFMQGNDIFIH